jgi:hypothetical protein
MSSDTVIMALRHSRLQNSPWSDIINNERGNRLGVLDQSQGQALAFDFASAQPYGSARGLVRLLSPNQDIRDLGFGGSDDAQNVESVIFISYDRHTLAFNYDDIVGAQFKRQAPDSSGGPSETLLRLSGDFLGTAWNADSKHDWPQLQLATAPTELPRILSLENSEIWEDQDDARFDLLVERELSRQLESSEREELETLSQKRDRTLARVSREEIERENLKEAALIELQNLVDKYAPLFAKRP